MQVFRRLCLPFERKAIMYVRFHILRSDFKIRSTKMNSHWLQAYESFVLWQMFGGVQ